MKRKNEAAWVESAQRWQINVQKDGKRRTFVSSKQNSRPDCKKGKIEAEKKADKWLESATLDEGTKCSVLLDKFLEEVKTRTGTSNSVQTEKFIRIYIKPAIGSVKIKDLTEGHLQSILNKARGHGKTNEGEHLAEKTLKGIRGCMMAFLKYCRRYKYTTLHVEGLTIPNGAKKSERTILQPADLTLLFQDPMTLYRGVPRPEPFIHAYRFAAVTGLRPGELLGLRRSDLSDGVYKIRQSINEYGEHTTGKNDNARRTGALSDVAMKILKDQKAMLRGMGIVSPYLFPDTDGSALTQKKFYAHWKRYCEYHEISEGTRPYELRHTFCSVNDELPDGLKKMIMGHSQSMDTNGVYSHRKRGDMEKAASLINDAYAPFVQAK